MASKTYDAAAMQSVCFYAQTAINAWARVHTAMFNVKSNLSGDYIDLLVKEADMFELKLHVLDAALKRLEATDGQA